MKLIRDLVNQTIGKLNYPIVEFSVEHPREQLMGEYSSNVAMVLSKSVGQNPRNVANAILEKLNLNNVNWGPIEKIEVAGAGFINFYLKTEYLVSEAKQSTQIGYGRNDILKNQKTFVEFTDPNPFKEFHIGHLMSNTIGESLARILEASGATIKRANYQGDVGLHVTKSIWGLQKKMEIDSLSLKDLQGLALKARVAYLGQAYAYGATKYEEELPMGEAGESPKEQMNALNKDIYDGLSGSLPGDSRQGSTMELYHAGRAWSLEYFETIYARLGTKFDEYFFESEAGPVGLKVVEEAIAKKVLEVGKEGAVVFPGEKYGLHTRVFRNKLGLPTYEAKELGLAKTKWERWQYDRSYIITANEIDEYFKVLLKTLSLLYPDLAQRTTHLSHGIMKLTTGKMSSRTGKVVTGEGLLNELKEVVMKKMGERDIKDRDNVADIVAVGALKYTVLKQAIGGDITYDPEKITNMEGDTGPYLQYTFARTQSVIKKAETDKSVVDETKYEWNTEELNILKWIYRYPEVVADAGVKYAPHMIASYIYELAQRFNTFYNQHQIVGNPNRLLLTRSVAETLKSGLGLLGIVAPSEM